MNEPTREDLEQQLRNATLEHAKCRLRLAAIQFGNEDSDKTEAELYMAARNFTEAELVAA